MLKDQNSQFKKTIELRVNIKIHQTDFRLKWLDLNVRWRL